MKIVDLIEAVHSTPDINKKFDHVVTALATQQIATTNALLATLTAIRGTSEETAEALKSELLTVKAAPISSKDIDPGMYAQVMDLFISRLR